MRDPRTQRRSSRGSPISHPLMTAFWMTALSTWQSQQTETQPSTTSRLPPYSTQATVLSWRCSYFSSGSPTDSDRREDHLNAPSSEPPRQPPAGHANPRRPSRVPRDKPTKQSYGEK